jgi:hypothetical protein
MRHIRFRLDGQPMSEIDTAAQLETEDKGYNQYAPAADRQCLPKGEPATLFQNRPVLRSQECILNYKTAICKPGMMIYHHNPSYSGGTDRRIIVSSPYRQKKSSSGRPLSLASIRALI